MTNTETVSTERKVWPLGGYAPGHYQNNCVGCGKDFIGDKRSVECLECAVANANRIIDEALSARTQSPAEWSVELPDDLRHTFPSSMPANWPDVLESRAKADYLGDSKGTVDLLRATAIYLRAASIPAPERSKEETGVKVKPTVTQAEADVLGMPAEVAQRVVDWYWSALETPPLHKEGEAVAWRWRVKGDQTWTYDPAQGFVDKHIADPTMEFERVYAAPVPVPVTDEMVKRLSDELWARLDLNGHTGDGVRKVARAGLAAALSQKPGEQG